MPLATRMQKVATKLLTKYDERNESQKLILINKGAKTFNPAEGEYEFAADSQVPLTGAAVPYNQNMIDGTTVKAGDMVLTITNAVKPEMSSKVLVDGTQYSIVNIQPFSYTGESLNICYKVQLRNG